MWLCILRTTSGKRLPRSHCVPLRLCLCALRTTVSSRGRYTCCTSARFLSIGISTRGHLHSGEAHSLGHSTQGRTCTCIVDWRCGASRRFCKDVPRTCWGSTTPETASSFRTAGLTAVARRKTCRADGSRHRRCSCNWRHPRTGGPLPLLPHQRCKCRHSGRGWNGSCQWRTSCQSSRAHTSTGTRRCSMLHLNPKNLYKCRGGTGTPDRHCACRTRARPLKAQEHNTVRRS